MAPLIRANSLYTIVNGPSWADGESNAVAKGGHLATVENEAEDRWLFATFVQQAPTENYADSLWIGLNDAETEGIFKWSSGAPVTYINLEAGNNAEHQDWIQYWGKSGVWDTLDFLGWPWGSGRNGIAEIPLTSSITFSSTPKEGAGIFDTSINLSAGTQSTGNLAEGATVYWKVTGITADDLATGALTGSGTISNGKLVLQHSLKTDTDTGEKFEVSVFSDAGMTQQIGMQTSEVVLEASTIPAVKTTSNPIVARGNSLYAIVKGPSWTQAEANAVKVGGHLISIDNSAENDFVTKSFDALSSEPDLWIGLTDRDEEGVWRHANGTLATYFNWLDGRTNNDYYSSSDEDFLTLVLDPVNGHQESDVGKWNDLPNSLQGLPASGWPVEEPLKNPIE